jgi:hypothetical protein
MAYTWGYIKDVSLSKLDLEEPEATVQNLLSRFPFYANEVITQICSSIKPKYTFAKFDVYKNDMEAWNSIKQKYNVYGSHDTPIEKPTECSEIEEKFWSEYDAHGNIGESIRMPSDFVSFGDDVCYQLVQERDFLNDIGAVKKELHDDDFEYLGYNQVVFKRPGNYFISYNARWYTFNKSLSDDEVINVPNDILECIPSYIASQCYKIDDEYKASVFRNEYEIMLSRIDNSNFKNTKTIKIEGDW